MKAGVIATLRLLFARQAKGKLKLVLWRYFVNSLFWHGFAALIEPKLSPFFVAQQARECVKFNLRCFLVHPPRKVERSASEKRRAKFAHQRRK